MVPLTLAKNSSCVLNTESPVNTSKISVGIDGHYFVAKQDSTNSAGDYSIYLVNDPNPDYSLHITAPGYYNLSTRSFSVAGNESGMKHNMTPLASIGDGVSILNLSSNPETDSPSLTLSALQNDLGNKSDNSSFAIANNTTDRFNREVNIIQSEKLVLWLAGFEVLVLFASLPSR